MIQIEHHTRRLYERAKTLAIQPCLKEDMMLGKIIDTVRAGFGSYLYDNTREDLAKGVFQLRLIYSSGHGDFGIAARDNGCVFYAIMSESKREFDGKGVKEYTTRELHFNIDEYTPTQTGNQIQHAIMKGQAEKKGGFSGIKYTKDKILLQASAGNLGFIFENPFQLVIPRKDKIIMNESFKQSLEYLNSPSKKQKINVIERDVTMEQVYLSKEMMIFGKDQIIPVLELNDRVIGKEKGPVTAGLQKWYQQMFQQGVIVQI